VLAAAVLVAGSLVGSALWESVVVGGTRQPGSAVTPIETSAAPRAQSPAPAVVMATFDTILATRSPKSVVYRLLENPRIIVVDFATLAEQGQTMNRLAALIEKTGAPRDRVLAEGELMALIKAEGSNAATFYIGHDYAAPALARFFSLASSDRQLLNESEVRLHDLLLALGVIVVRDAGYAPGNPEVAVVTTVQPQSDDPATPQNETIDVALRTTILRHEVSHGEFFTNEAYRRYCEWFWRARLSEGERTLFRAMLSKSGYNEDDETLMINEMQAHLMHTPDPRAFSARRLCVSEAELADLQQRFMAGNPPTFLLAGVRQGN